MQTNQNRQFRRKIIYKKKLETSAYSVLFNRKANGTVIGRPIDETLYIRHTQFSLQDILDRDTRYAIYF